LKKQGNIEDLTKIEDVVDANRSYKKSMSGEKKTIGFSLKDDTKLTQSLDPKDFNELNTSFINENEDDATTYQYEEDFFLNEETTENLENLNRHNQANHNLQLKIDDNLSFIEDELDNNDYMETNKIHASINQYKLKFLGSVSINIGMSRVERFFQFSIYDF
jgi:hypothetical protein